MALARLKFRFVLLAPLILCACSSDAFGQTCSKADGRTRAEYEQASLAALTLGDLDRYRTLQVELPGALSNDCRILLDQMEPMRVRCSATEKSQVLRHVGEVVELAWSGEVLRLIATWENLERAVSPACWLAANRHTDPRVVNACTYAELDHMASYAGPMLRAARAMLTTGDMSVLNLNMEVMTSISPRCGQAVAMLQQQYQQQPQGSPAGTVASVLDHGGGTYSAPGLGACTPSGCIAF